MVQASQSLFGTPGLNFTGSPGMTVKRIRAEWDLAREIRDANRAEGSEKKRAIANLIEYLDWLDYFHGTKEKQELIQYLGKPYIENDDRINLITARRVLTHTTGFPNWRPRDQPYQS